MRLGTPPRAGRVDDLFDLSRVDERFQGAVWDLISDYRGKLTDDELRHALEEILMMVYDLHGDGTVGSA